MCNQSWLHNFVALHAKFLRVMHHFIEYDGQKEVINVSLDGRCRLEPLALERILDNPLLAMSVQETEVQHCLEGIKQYGLLNPLVLSRGNDETYTVIAGSCELQALRRLKIRRTDAVIVSGLAPGQTHQLSLHLLSLRSCKDSLSEAFLVQNLLRNQQLSQSDVAKMVGRSVSWVSKRALLAERLNPSVQKMIMEKIIPARSAQEIAKLPPEVQHAFATRVVSESLPKSAIESLVTAYNRVDTTAAVKRQILESPKQTLPYCLPKRKKTKDPTHEQLEQTKRLHSIINLLLKLTSDLEELWTEIPIIPEQMELALQKALERLLYLQKPLHSFAPGQVTKGEHHAN